MPLNNKDTSDLFLKFDSIIKKIIILVEDFVLNSDLMISESIIENTNTNINDKFKEFGIIRLTNTEFNSIETKDKRNYVFYKKGNYIYGIELDYKVDTAIYNNIDNNIPNKNTGIINPNTEKDRQEYIQNVLDKYKNDKDKEDRPYYKK